MIKVEDKTKCCGCTACANICPKYCITMQADKEGFLYPTVDIEKCVDCGLCEKVCPILHTTKKNITKPKTYAIQLKNSKQLKESASGGAYSALSKVILKQDGIVWGLRMMRASMLYIPMQIVMKNVRNFKVQSMCKAI